MQNRVSRNLDPRSLFGKICENRINLDLLIEQKLLPLTFPSMTILVF